MDIRGSSISRQPPLRLVRPGEEQGGTAASPTASPKDRRAEAYERIARENQAAARTELDPADPRWVLAVRVAQALEGAQLRPERREKLLKLATHLGLRAFDANLVIALVQDRARRGELEMTLGAGLTRDMAHDLKLIPAPAHRQASWWASPWLRRLLLMALSLFWAGVIIRWLLTS
ncbi:MAG: hypothetical protein ACF8NJ_08090 [Phycisphaerales bacterium JB038]